MSDRQPSESARQALGAQLRDLRLGAGLTGVELARRCGWHKTKVSKIEHATQNPSEDDIRRWAVACGAGASIAELIAAGREIEHMWTDYRRRHRRGMKRLQFHAMDLYAASKLIRVYESLFIPGFLQTVEYAEAQFTIHAGLHGLPVGDVAEAAQNRMARKRFLGTGAPAFAFLLEASALTNNTGGVDVMNAQLDHLHEVSALPYVSVGIIPEGRTHGFWCIAGAGGVRGGSRGGDRGGSGTAGRNLKQRSGVLGVSVPTVAVKERDRDGRRRTVGKHEAPKEKPQPIKLPKPTSDGDRPVKKGGK